MDTITLKPQIRYWLQNYFLVLPVAAGIVYLSRKYIVHEYVETAILVLLAVIFIVLLYTYVDMLLCTIWQITEYNIQIIRGVFNRKTDYIELYRVVDYKETQTLVQRIFKNKTVWILSGDRTTPVLLIFGIDYDLEIVEEIRKRVEIQKKAHGIYEITNR
ncbi:MAG: PH domain-containing protein [Bacteroidales bacterium]|nr:PH domain-containing protein [Bacteroidales bacterium]